MSNNLSKTMDAIMQNQGPIKEVRLRKFLLNRFMLKIEFQDTKEIKTKKEKDKK